MKTLLWILGGLWLLSQNRPTAVAVTAGNPVAAPTYAPDPSPLPPSDGLSGMILTRPARPRRPGTVTL